MKLSLKIISILLIGTMLTCAASCKGCSRQEQEGETPQAQQTQAPSVEKTPEPALSKGGSIYDNIGSFADEQGNPVPLWSEDGTLSDFQTAYFETIIYSIDSIDEKTMKAEVTISLPELAKPFEEAIEETMIEASELEYSEFLMLAEAKAAEKLRSGAVEKTSDTLSFDLVRADGELRLVMNDELSALIVGNIENALLEGYSRIMEDIENGTL